MSVPGGVGEEQPISEDVAQIAESVKHNVQQKLGNQHFHKYVPVSYASQVVNGTNYFIKVDIGEHEYIELRVYKSFSGDVQLAGVKSGLGAGSGIVYFDSN